MKWFGIHFSITRKRFEMVLLAKDQYKYGNMTFIDSLLVYLLFIILFYYIVFNIDSVFRLAIKKYVQYFQYYDYLW